MAQYLSADLRIRVIGAVEAGMSRNAAARRFGVSIASAVRWMDEYLRTGRTAPKPRGGDRRSGRIEAQADLLMQAIEETPGHHPGGTARAADHRAGRELRAQHDPRLLPPPRDHVQKKTAHASEQARADVAARREAWFELQPELDPAKLVFIDETGATTKMARLRGRSPRGERCRAAVPHGHWKTTTLVAGLRLGGLTAPMVIDGAMNGDAFTAYAERSSPPPWRRATSSSWTTCRPTRSAAHAPRSNAPGQRCCSFRRTPRTSIRSSRPSPRSRRSCARPPPGRCMRWKPLSRPHSTRSSQTNAQTTSPTPAISQIDPKML